ncbi:2-dehydro-3-deoxygalactonokinase [Frigidibacter sp. RF13]|uniref:2-dehydro-3-deoxygalactonokinase n=1 Tax=Frigidibacter sp. RF13 TaxID=2997340 RepID=UPI00226D71CD|nr:2-dehydro-3-deoxygalactonokinase [Frigidibacter sp. RF13]MCY1126895.1 2-dehydro-3-deoxygalactonokinase [Frigidibacter sp. RF13]
MSGQTERAAWIAVDWGTSNLRLWRMGPSGEVLGEARSDRGMGTLKPEGFEPVLLDLIANDLLENGRLTVIACGMVGARQGWQEARYVAVPATPPGISQALKVDTSDPRLSVHILPGMSQASPADVMRGEETQIAGFLSAEPAFDGVLCLPGTHCKWAHISAGEVVSFRTFMTGEIFALLSGQSVLRHSVAASGFDTEAFTAAVSHVMSRPQALAGDLFSIRAETLLSGLDAVQARSRLSGMLIGAELAAARPYWLGQEIVILGEGGLAGAYRTALAAQGAPARTVDAARLTLMGLTAAWRALAEGAQ